MNIARVIQGPLLIPRDGGRVDAFVDGAVGIDESGRIVHAGAFDAIAKQVDARGVESSRGVMLPPLVDIHIHVPQHPIRGHFVDGVPDDAPEGKLLAGLNRNVFPAEAECAVRERAEQVVRQFLQDTLRHGVVGGAAYMTTSPVATEAALSILPQPWSVGLVLMNQNTPDYLLTDESTVEADLLRLGQQFGRRMIVTDRFAVAVTTPLRQLASRIAGQLGLRTQTHLNEQVAEKRFVEETLYRGYASYTDVYLRDGLLEHDCIVAHCIQMRDDEWSILRDAGSVIAHCPTSNLLLGSGRMDLDAVLDRGLPYAIATDVGASPTVSMLAEMGRFLAVHAGKSSRATPAEALFRATLAPATYLGIDRHLGRLEAGRPASFVEVTPAFAIRSDATADLLIRSLLPYNLDEPSAAVRRVTLAGQTVFEAPTDA